MGDLKSQALEMYISLAAHLIKDSAAKCSPYGTSSAERDIQSLRARTQKEGVSFLTKKLPLLGKSLDKALSSDVPPVWPSDFKVSSKPPFCPVFLGGLWKCIFSDSGALRPLTNHSVAAVRAVRQICYLLYKLRGSHSKESEVATLQEFISCDAALPLAEAEVSLSAATKRALENARQVIWRVVAGLDLSDITPGHGPGAVATGEHPHEKMNFRRIYESLESEYPFVDYFFFNYTHLCDNLESLEDMETCPKSVAKVTLVPKDSRGPRIISMEPLEIQWIQQGILRALVQEIERDGSISSGYVNFTNQDVNRDLALRHSLSGEFVTLDMKEASDRVSVWLVRKLFPSHLFTKLMACRSSHTCLPDGLEIELKKFAPMGSSVCFPVEALVFWALAVGSLGYVGKGNAPNVYVFGDDIIASRGGYDSFKHVFEELFLKFNEDKCCTGRFFRESCGVDAFCGELVTPIRIKAPFTELSSPLVALSYLAYLRGLKERRLWRTADILQEALTMNLACIPVTNRHAPRYEPWAIYEPHWSNSEVLAYLRRNFKVRYNRALMRLEVRVKVPHFPTMKWGEPGWHEMLRLHRFWGHQSPSDAVVSLRACQYPVPHTVKMRWTWKDVSTFTS